jgi:hypothetical protein
MQCCPEPGCLRRGSPYRAQMGTHIQRKRFDHPQLAAEAARGFSDPSFRIDTDSVKVSASAVEIEGEYWCYVTQEGPLVGGDEPLLPDYERAE